MPPPVVLDLPLDAKTYAASLSFPPVADRRDKILQTMVFSECRQGEGTGRLVGGLDTRPNPVAPGEGEPKFVCGLDELAERKPCIVYSFGSYNEIMFEVGMKGLVPSCEVHTFDPFILPTQESVDRFGFNVWAWGIGTKANPKSNDQLQPLDEIMDYLGHKHIDVLKLDVEGAEIPFLDWLFDRPLLLQAIDQIMFEFHSHKDLEKYAKRVEGHGFSPVHARVNDQFFEGTEIAFQSPQLPTDLM
ncbi:hypothetical protein TrRE_jg6194 [Triparma retinervis]|uniref:Methyltransferase domain-containing protein n=1 Tax=Triparma retinervis TaxID=2557542 RepID=A0A9W7ANH2_9STRA|nr:hypothetical protein TrRE_jg6194 [Triparma retinervis]